MRATIIDELQAYRSRMPTPKGLLGCLPAELVDIIVDLTFNNDTFTFGSIRCSKLGFLPRMLRVSQYYRSTYEDKFFHECIFHVEIHSHSSAQTARKLDEHQRELRDVPVPKFMLGWKLLEARHKSMTRGIILDHTGLRDEPSLTELTHLCLPFILDTPLRSAHLLSADDDDVCKTMSHLRKTASKTAKQKDAHDDLLLPNTLYVLLGGREAIYSDLPTLPLTDQLTGSPWDALKDLIEQTRAAPQDQTLRQLQHIIFNHIYYTNDRWGGSTPWYRALIARWGTEDFEQFGREAVLTIHQEADAQGLHYLSQSEGYKDMYRKWWSSQSEDFKQDAPGYHPDEVLHVND